MERFNKSFFRLALGFIAVIVVSISIIKFISYYSVSVDSDTILATSQD